MSKWQVLACFTDRWSCHPTIFPFISSVQVAGFGILHRQMDCHPMIILFISSVQVASFGMSDLQICCHTTLMNSRVPVASIDLLIIQIVYSSVTCQLCTSGRYWLALLHHCSTVPAVLHCSVQVANIGTFFTFMVYYTFTVN